MTARHYVRILDPRRRADWLAALGTDTVPVLGDPDVPYVVIASAPGIDAGLFYQLDLDALTHDQQERLVSRLCEQFGVDAMEIPVLLARDGVPILADHTELVRP